MIKAIAVLCGDLYLFISTAVLAASDLYQTEVIVASGSEPDRSVIVQKAYQQILVKVAGNREILENQAVKAQASKANQMVTGFHYLDSSNDVNSRTIAIQFDPAHIQEVLLAAGQEVWAGKRPAIVLWLIDADPKSEQIYNDDNEPTVQQVVNRIHLERGIDLTLPLLDLQDLANISASNIRQLDLEVITAASRRYEAPLQLVGQIKPKVNEDDTSITIDWYLIQEFSRRHFISSGDSISVALRSGLDESIDTIARRYARRTTSQEGKVTPVTLTVYGVNDINHYAQLLEYLRQLALVTQVDIKHIGSEDVTLQIAVKGGRLALVKLLSNDNELQPLREGGALDSQNLRYQMVR